MSEEISRKYRRFPSKMAKLRDILPLMRSSCASNYDEGGKDVVLCLECEEWTHVKFNLNSCLLDLLGDLIVESIDVEDDNLILWIKTDEYNWFNIGEEESVTEQTRKALLGL